MTNRIQYRKIFKNDETDRGEIASTYIQGRALGVNGTGKTILCTNVESNNQVIMKIVNKEKAFANTVQAKAFEKEIETLMLIEHPNLAKQ